MSSPNEGVGKNGNKKHGFFGEKDFIRQSQVVSNQFMISWRTGQPINATEAHSLVLVAEHPNSAAAFCLQSLVWIGRWVVVYSMNHVRYSILYGSYFLFHDQGYAMHVEAVVCVCVVIMHHKSLLSHANMMQ